MFGCTSHKAFKLAVSAAWTTGMKCIMRWFTCYLQLNNWLFQKEFVCSVHHTCHVIDKGHRIVLMECTAFIISFYRHVLSLGFVLFHHLTLVIDEFMYLSAEIVWNVHYIMKQLLINKSRVEVVKDCPSSIITTKINARGRVVSVLDYMWGWPWKNSEQAFLFQSTRVCAAWC